MRGTDALPLLPQEIIRRKRDGGQLEPAEIDAFIAGLTDGSIADAQVAAFAMAAFLRGLAPAETVALTRAMTHSGRVMEWRDLDRPILDKHSTGGVGDKVSLMLAPIIAACGGAVPMISGRGLGHTGGTLDKLDSIPGYTTQPDIDRFRRVVAEVGCAIIGQTGDLAPADRRLYAIRDVTATVESIPLITASILAKKLAAGLQGLIMDVKVGSGAFMNREDDAAALARSIVTVAEGAGLRTRALVTDMDQVLGRTAGNALEVKETVDYLTGDQRDGRLDRVVRALSGELLTLGGLAADAEAAEAAVAKALASGAAAEAFQHMVALLGGPADILEGPDRYLPKAPTRLPAPPLRPGFVSSIDVRAVGLTVLSLGGGRVRADQNIDPAVGLTDVAGIGEEVGPKRPLAIVHARDAGTAQAAIGHIQQAFRIGDAAPAESPVVRAKIDRDSAG